MDRPVVTNVSIYKAIAKEAYAQVLEASQKNRTPKPDGSGYILRYDPDRTSFKSSLITVVFTGMWIEALTHLLIVRDHGEEKYREYDRKSYEEKFRLFGIEDEELLSLVAKFRATRKELVHEKAHFDIGTIKTAQKEAEVAHEIMRKIELFLANQALKTDAAKRRSLAQR